VSVVSNNNDLRNSARVHAGFRVDNIGA
jgi:hypothetical protein